MSDERPLDHGLEDSRDPFAEIVDGYLESLRRGETACIEDVAEQHPEFAESIRRLLPALVELERLGGDAGPAEIAPVSTPRSTPRPDSGLREVPRDRYADFRVIGKGGMGVVYWAIDSDLNRQVAFKVVRPSVGTGAAEALPESPIGMNSPDRETPASRAFETLKARFLQEARVTAGLEHPGIVPVYEVGETPEGVPYYTMRFVRGSRTLANAIEEASSHPMEQRLQLLDAFLRVCDTVRYAHAHDVIHRDLKPSNIGIGEFGEVVVLDWGLAKLNGSPDAAEDLWKTRLREFRDAADFETVAVALGTPGYMSPEAATGRVAEVDAQSDVYSLGAILFEIITGALPYRCGSYSELLSQLRDAPDPTLVHLAPSTPSGLADICERTLRKDRESRTKTVDELASAIRAWQSERDVDRELDALQVQAEAALESAAELTGDLRLHQLDRAAALCTQILERRAAEPAAMDLQRRIHGLRKQGVAERERAARGRAFQRAGIAALVVASIAGAVVAKVLDERREQAEIAQVETIIERDAKDEALRQVREESEAKSAALSKAEENLLRAKRNLAQAHIQAAQRLIERSWNPELGRSGTLDSALVHLAEARAADASSVGIAAIQAADDRRRAPVWQRRSPFAGLRSAGARCSAAGGVVAAFTTRGRCVVWDAGTGWPIRELNPWLRPELAENPSAIAVRADGHAVYLATRSGTLVEWDLETDTLTRRITKGGWQIEALECSEDGTTLAVADVTGAVHRVDTTSWHVSPLPADGGGRVDRLALSADGQRIAAALQPGSVLVWSLGAAEPQRLDGHAADRRSEVLDLAFTPDGEALRTAGRDGTVRTWDVATGRESGRIDGPGDGFWSAELTSDATRVAALGSRALRVLDAETGAIIGEALTTVDVVAFLDDHTRVLCADGSTYSAETLQRNHRPDWQAPATGVPCFVPGGRLLAVPTRGGVELVDVTTGDTLRTLLPEGAPSHAVAVSPDARTLAIAVWVAAQDGPPSRGRSDVEIVRLPSGESLGRLRAHRRIESLAFSPDGRRLATSGSSTRDGSERGPKLRLWDVSTLQEIDLVSAGQHRVLKSMRFASNGRHLLGIAGGALVEVDTSGGTHSRTILSKDHAVRAFDVDSEGQMAVALCESELISLSADFVDVIERAPLSPNWRSGREHEWVSIQDEGRALFFAKHGSEPALWSWQTRREATVFGAREPIPCVRLDSFVHAVLSPDGLMLAALDASGDIALVDLRGPAILARPLSGAAWAGPGRVVMAQDDVLRVLDAATGEEISRISPSGRRKLIREPRDVSTGRSRPTGRRIATDERGDVALVACDVHSTGDWTSLGQTYVVGLRSARVLHQLPSPGSGPAAVSISRDGTLGGVAYQNGLALIWDLKMGKELCRFDGHTAPLSAIDLTRDGSLAVTVGADGVSVWNARSGDLIRRLSRSAAVDSQVCFVDNGERVASDSVGRSELTIWNVRDGTSRALSSGGAWALRVVPRADGDLLASMSADRLSLRRVDDGTEVSRADGLGPYRASRIPPAATHPDGRSIVTTAGWIDVDFAVATWERRSTWSGETWLRWARLRTGMELDRESFDVVPACSPRDAGAPPRIASTLAADERALREQRRRRVELYAKAWDASFGAARDERGRPDAGRLWDRDIDRWRAVAAAALESGNHAERQRALRRIVERVPSDVESWTALAKRYTRIGELGEAIAAYRRLADLQPADLQAHRAVVRALCRAHRYTDAAEAGGPALQLTASPEDRVAVSGKIYWHVRLAEIQTRFLPMESMEDRASAKTFARMRPAVLVVKSIDHDSAAERAGVQKGDVIRRIDGKDGFGHSTRAKKWMPKGDGPFELTLDRSGTEIVATVPGGPTGIEIRRVEISR